MLLPGGDSFVSIVSVMVCPGTTSAGNAIVTERGHDQVTAGHFGLPAE
jgi:hypothetical protein